MKTFPNNSQTSTNVFVHGKVVASEQRNTHVTMTLAASAQTTPHRSKNFRTFPLYSRRKQLFAYKGMICFFEKIFNANL